MTIAEITVEIGGAALPMADALALYKGRRTAWRKTLNDEAYVEGVALWNAIIRADKIAKGIPVGRPISSPRIDAATARLVADLTGAVAVREAA